MLYGPEPAGLADAQLASAPCCHDGETEQDPKPNTVWGDFGPSGVAEPALLHGCWMWCEAEVAGWLHTGWDWVGVLQVRSLSLIYSDSLHISVPLWEMRNSTCCSLRSPGGV